MFFKSITLLVTIGAALAMMPLQPTIHAERSMMDFMLQPRAINAVNPELNQYCFNRYVPLLQGIADQYEKDYGICVEAYNKERLTIDAKFTKSRDDISFSARATCDALQKCDGIVSYVDSFECFESTGSDQSKLLFALSADAGEYAKSIKELYRVAESTAEICVGYAERAYWENTSKTYDDLGNCLSGSIAEPSSSTSTTTSTSTSTKSTTRSVTGTTS